MKSQQRPTCIICLGISYLYFVIWNNGITFKHQHVLPQLFIGPFDFKMHPKKTWTNNCRNKQKTHTHTHEIISWCWNSPSPAPCPQPDYVFCQSFTQHRAVCRGVPPSIRDGKITTKTQEIWTWLSPESKPVWEKGSFSVLLGGWMHPVQTSYVIELRSSLVKHITTNSTVSTI